MMHGSAFHSFWMLPLNDGGDHHKLEEFSHSHSNSAVPDSPDCDDGIHSLPSSSSRSSSSSSLLPCNDPERRTGPPGRRYANKRYTEALTQMIAKKSSTDSNPYGTKSTPKTYRYTLSHAHLILLLVTSSINALMVKVFCVFSGFINIYYEISFTTLTLILGIATLSTISAVFINQYILYLRCNVLIFMVQSLQIIGIVIIVTFEHYIALTIGIICIFNTYQIHWGVANTMIACFIQPGNSHKRARVKHAAMTKKKYLTIFNTQWTISAFFFVIVGVVSQSVTFVGFLSLIAVLSIILAILNIIVLPKQPALPSLAKLKHVSTQVHFFNLVPQSLTDDARSLVQNKKFMFVCLGFMLTFFIWGWFYVTFGPFVQQMYAFNSLSTFGAYCTVIESIGNAIAMTSYIYCGSMLRTRSQGISHRQKYTHLETETLLLCSAVILLVSLLCITLITHVLALTQSILPHKVLTGALMICYFVGHEGCVIGLMILHVEVTPILRQPRASGVVSMVNCVMVFISQSIIIGPLDSKYYQIPFETEVLILCMISVGLLAVTAVLAVHMRRSRAHSNKQRAAAAHILPAQYFAHTPILHHSHGHARKCSYHTMKTVQNRPNTDLWCNDDRHFCKIMQ